MKILIHGLNFSPELIGIGKYTGEMALWLANAGHDVHVVTAPPYYPDWKVQPPYNTWQFQTEIWQDVKVIRCPLWVPSKVTGFTRILHLLSFSITSFFAMVRQIKTKPDVVISIVPTLFAASTAAWVAHRCKAISWLHIQDFELDAAANLGMVHSKNIAMRLAIRWEKSVLSKFDRVSSISKQMVKRINAKGIQENKTVLFPNWVNTKSIFPMQTTPKEYRSRLGISDNQIMILYSGNMGEKQGLGLIVDMARQLQENPHLVFVLCGNGSLRSNLEKAANGLNNVKFLDLQPPEQLNLLLNSADIHLLPQQAGAADLVMPSKLLGMLASGRPVIATANQGTELADVVAQVGIITPPGDVDSMVKAILKLAESSELRQQMGQKSVELVKNKWSQEKILSDFTVEVEKMISLNQD